MTRGILILASALAVRAAPPYEQRAVPLELRMGRSTRTVEAVVRVPAGARPGVRMPAVVVLGGFDAAGKVLDLFQPDVPAVLAAFDYPYAGPKRFRFPRSLLDAPRFRDAIRETSAAVVELSRVLRGLPGVDPDRVCVVGASFGSLFALHAASQDPDIRCLVLVQGFADVRGTMTHRLAQQWESRLGRFARGPAWLASAALVLCLDPPRPERDAARLRSGQRVLDIEAQGDTFIPKASKDLLWESLKGSKAEAERLVLPGDHLRPEAAGQIREITEAVERWLARPPSARR